MASQVFISYSHADTGRIQPIIDLIRTLRRGLVFQDKHSIKAGRKWRPQILKALKESDLVIIFWCVHSKTSKYVKEECQIAIKTEKDILPLLLDQTPLPSILNPYQWIDLRGSQFHTPLKRAIGKLPGMYSNLHFYPRDEYGEIVDWESRWHQEDLARDMANLARDHKSVAKKILRGIAKVLPPHA